MSASKSSLWCVVKECNNTTEKRHFFLFPKEYDRWLQWIRACGRYDLEVMGPEYAHRNYRLCHLHFEEKWYKIGKSRANLHPDAIPTIFFGTNNTSVTSENVGNIVEACQKEETSSNIQSTEILPMDTYADIAKPSTSSNTDLSTVTESPRKRKLKDRNLKLKAENKMLRERIRRLQKKIEKLKNIRKNKEDVKEHESLRQLGCKLLPPNVAQLLSALGEKI
ncbi:52 kDa repressor of the inhibitor of the protein kinase isoform X1 [Solenopsis invicta]|uniref:52 kDa repressor of the inhibitor of the protein kinase isoform X1 n=2 Tax=Solenopsis invicta TaxID=13686 RepID=UPI00193D6DC7|nr:52 kDa repressor of the inhibitor of the protein kinase isoform X1 [Solenopsis invicta]